MEVCGGSGGNVISGEQGWANTHPTAGKAALEVTGQNRQLRQRGNKKATHPKVNFTLLQEVEVTLRVDANRSLPWARLHDMVRIEQLAVDEA